MGRKLICQCVFSVLDFLTFIVLAMFRDSCISLAFSIGNNNIIIVVIITITFVIIIIIICHVSFALELLKGVYRK